VISRPAVRPALILAVTILTALASVLEAPSQLRLILLLAFLTFLPGLSLAAMFPPRDMVSAIAFAVGLSLALDLIIVTTTMYTGVWSPATLLVVLLAITLVVSGAQLAGVMGLVTWPTIKLPTYAVTGGPPGSRVDVAPPNFEGWYQVTSGPFKGMWTKSALLPRTELLPYPGLSSQPGVSPEPEAKSESELRSEPELASEPEPALEPEPASWSEPAARVTNTRILRVSSPVKRGANATVIANTEPHAACHIMVNYGSGPRRVAGPQDKSADDAGWVSWNWRIGTRTAPGTWTIDVICEPGGSASATLTIS
jgi:hypothetical protein